MREISAETIRDTVSELCIEANLHLPADITAALKKAKETIQISCGSFQQPYNFVDQLANKNLITWNTNVRFVIITFALELHILLFRSTEIRTYGFTMIV